MTPESLERIESIYNEALALPAEERPAFLDRACGDDRNLRAEIESLLLCEQQARTCLDKPAIHFVAEQKANDQRVFGGILAIFELDDAALVDFASSELVGFIIGLRYDDRMILEL